MFEILFKPVTLFMWKIVILFAIFETICMDPRFKSMGADSVGSIDECQLTPVIHVLQYPGCIPKPIPSFACMGRCASYLQAKLKNFYLLNFEELQFCRCREAKFGKWKDHVCVVKNRVKEKHLCQFFVHKQNLERRNSER